MLSFCFLSSGSYLHIQPATLESLTRSAANASASRTRRKVTPSTEASIKEEGGSGAFTVSVLPPSLRGLVLIWQEITATCAQAMALPNLPLSPSLPTRLSKNAALNKEKIARQEVKKTSRKKKVCMPHSHIRKEESRGYFNSRYV